MEQRFRRQLLLAVALSTIIAGSVASTPLPIEDLARYPVIQSVSMSADGKRLVALVSSPDGKTEPALANWDLDDLAAGPKRVTPSGERMKFVAAIAMKAGRTLAIARQEWTGRLAGCGEGNTTGATKTFVSKAYITDVAQEKFDEAFASSVRRAGISEDTQRCFEIGGSADLVHGLPLEPDHVIVRQSNPSSLSADYYRYNLKTGAAELLLRADAKTSPGLFHPRSGELLTRETLESAGPDEFEARTQIKDRRSSAFVTHDALTVKVSERVNLSVVGVDDDTGKLYILTDKFSDHMQAWAYDPATQTFDKEPLVAHAAGSITRLHFDTRSATFNKITGYVVNTQRAETVYVDPLLCRIRTTVTHLSVMVVLTVAGLAFAY
ncbi:hypothetical protein KQ945_15540, partial [Bacillus subtilis subsp. subtilis]|nr:hypothetical protein [Bacillus subtilis subsp. subtilis]